MSVEAMKQALYLIRNQGDVGVDEWIAAEAALCTAIEQAEKRDVERSSTESKETFDQQEPVATLDDLEQEIYENTRQFVSRDVMEWMLKRYYTTPPQRKPLTDDEIKEIFLRELGDLAVRIPPGWRKVVNAIEAAHGIKE